MAQTQIGAQLYTLRDHLKTPDDMARTFERVKAMGYDAVQCSALGPIESQALGKLLRDADLQCAVTHVSPNLITDTNACVDHHRALDCKYTAVGGAGRLLTAEQWIDFATTYNTAAMALAEHDIYAGYHNHSHELARYGGQCALDLILDHTGPPVWIELDTYWIVYGGGDPISWIDWLGAMDGNRVPCIHVKDMAVTPQAEQMMCEVGEGNLNWPGILDAARRADVQWYLVERDDGELDPFESLKISLDNMKAMGLA